MITKTKERKTKGIVIKSIKDGLGIDILRTPVMLILPPAEGITSKPLTLSLVQQGDKWVRIVS